MSLGNERVAWFNGRIVRESEVMIPFRDQGFLKGDAVFDMTRRFDGKAWGPVQPVTEKPSDVFVAKMGRDRNGNVWVVWSAQVGGNFDLYGRRFDGDDRESPLPEDPGLADLPPLLPWWGPQERWDRP